MPVIGELVASRVPEHVGTNWERELGGFPGPSDRFQETRGRRWSTTLGDEDIPRFHILPASPVDGPHDRIVNNLVVGLLSSLRLTALGPCVNGQGLGVL